MTGRLRDLLARRRNADGGLPYYAGRKSRLEPTAWALLALGDAKAHALLASWRSPKGLIVEPEIGSVNYGFNGLAALALAANPSAEPAGAGAAVARQLQAHRGERESAHPAIKQDPNLQGWSWTDGTFSWVEPTAWCTLAVKKLASGDPAARARIDEAEKVLVDRACVGGGWNAGNSEVYGLALPAYAPPTAVGVLALQNRRQDRVVVEATGFLRQHSAREGSTIALALSWLALTAIGDMPAQLAGTLADRLPVTESQGNLAWAALMLYVLERHAMHAPPQALML